MKISNGVAVAGLTVMFAAAPAHAVLQMLTVSGNDSRYWPDAVERTTSGTASGSFTRDYGVPQFNPLLGKLILVGVEWHGGNDLGGAGPGAVEYGLSPNGPNFPGGSGTVSGSATLGVELMLPTATPLSDSTTVNGSHTGSIAGPPGAGSTDTKDVPLEFTGSRSFSVPSDLALFEGEGDVPFRSTFSASVTVNATTPGPNFGIGASLIPGLGTDVDVTYTYDGPVLTDADYNASGLVEQGDLDLVLANWGGSTPRPTGWAHDLPVGQVDQAELDKVLTNWGASAAPDLDRAALPEPAGVALVSAGLVAVCRRRRA